MAIIHESREMDQIAFALKLVYLLKFRDEEPVYIDHIPGRLFGIDTNEEEVLSELQRLATPPHGYVEILPKGPFGLRVKIAKAGLALLGTANPARNLKRSYRKKKLILPTPS